MSAEGELKYAARCALAWFQGAMTEEAFRPWVDTVLMQMLEIAINHSTAEEVMPVPDKDDNGQRQKPR